MPTHAAISSISKHSVDLAVMQPTKDNGKNPTLGLTNPALFCVTSDNIISLSAIQKWAFSYPLHIFTYWT